MRTIAIATLCAAAVATTLALGSLRCSEPRFAGKRMTFWLEKLDSQDPAEWARGVEAVRTIGTNALPVLGARLRAMDSPARRKAIDFFSTYPVVQLDSAESGHESALEACRVLGPDAASLVADILPFLAGNRRTKALRVLVAVGEPAILPLTRSLADERARPAALAALGTLARQPETVVPAVASVLADPQTETRMAAAWALGRFGGSALRARAQLCALTNDPASNVRDQARLALSRIDSAFTSLVRNAYAGVPLH